MDGVRVLTPGGKERVITGDRIRAMAPATMAELARRFSPEKIGDLLEELCNAESVTNGGRRIADNRTRLAAVTLTLAYLIGRPVERQEIISVNLDADSSAGLFERLKASPALRSSLKKLLEDVEAVDVETPVEQSADHKM